jgi:hypothetical protein
MPSGVLPRRFFLRAGHEPNTATSQLPDENEKQIKFESLERDFDMKES